MTDFLDMRNDWRTLLYLNWILPIQTIILLIVCIHLFKDSKIELAHLKKEQGIITNMTYFERATSNSRNPIIDTCLTLIIDNGHILTLDNDFRKKFDELINPHEMIGLVDYYFRYRKNGNIKFYQLKVDNTMIKEITDSNNESISVSVLTGFVSFISLIGYIIWRYAEASPENKYKKRFDAWIDKIFND